jgi:MIP family channel proteins
MINPLPRLVAEFLGAFTLVFAGVGASIIAIISQDQSALTVAFATGLAIFVMVAIFISVSGAHFNPAVSLAMLITGRLPFADFIAYVAAQLAGATAAAALIKFGYPAQVIEATGLGVPTARVEWSTALLLEVVMTLLLVLVIFGAAVDRRSTMGSLAGAPIGMVITMNILIAGPITGAAMNPARWFGPVVLQGEWGALTNIAIYTVGPLLGGVLAAVLYDYVIARRPQEPERSAVVADPEATI